MITVKRMHITRRARGRKTISDTPRPTEVTESGRIPGALHLDLKKLKFYVDEEPVDLTTTEFRLLTLLIENRGMKLAIRTRPLLRASIFWKRRPSRPRGFSYSQRQKSPARDSVRFGVRRPTSRTSSEPNARVVRLGPPPPTGFGSRATRSQQRSTSIRPSAPPVVPPL